MNTVLTSGGKPLEAVGRVRSNRDALNAWEIAVRRLLELSAATTPKRARILQMRTWLDANTWHEKFAVREAQYQQEYQALNAEFGTVCDWSVTVMRLQVELDDRTKCGLSALLGHELAPNAGTHWATYAQKLGTTDLFRIASVWLSEMRAEDEG
jgi:hypothetical protein